MATATKTDWLRAKAQGNTIGVDREAGIIRGYVVAQEGPFKSEDRGEFDKGALKTIIKLMKTAPNGLKSRFAHPSLSDDGIGKFLGRSRNPRLDKLTIRDSESTRKNDEIAVVRADLHLDPSSRNTPSGDLGGYVMELAESDPDALSSSLVIQAEQEYRIDKKGRPLKDDDGNELPPLWRPTRLHASDVVDTGDAVDGFLSAEGLPDEIVRRGAELLDRQFPNASREAIEARCQAWLARYLNYRFPVATPYVAAPILARGSENVKGDAEVVTTEKAGAVAYDPAADAEKEIIRRRNRERQADDS